MKSFHLLFLLTLFITNSVLAILFSHFSTTKKTKRKKNFISVIFPPQAGLGNCMFAYATMFAVAKKNNLIPVIPKNAKINESFNVTSLLTVNWHDNYPGNSFVPFREKGAAMFDPRTQNLPQENTLLCGYYQSWKYFSKDEADIRWEFLFKDDIRKEAQNILRSNLRKSSSDIPKVLVGIHVRRGNILNMETKKFGLKPATKSYLDNAMSYFKSKYPKCTFVVCSDDQRWCHENIVGHDAVFIESHSAVIDMAVLTLCNHTIITVGSFGWWSAYLAGGEVVYYKDWQHHNSELFNQTCNEDYFPPQWIGMV